MLSGETIPMPAPVQLVIVTDGQFRIIVIKALPLGLQESAVYALQSSRSAGLSGKAFYCAVIEALSERTTGPKTYQQPGQLCSRARSEPLTRQSVSTLRCSVR